MPRYRPPIDPSRIQFLVNWIRRQAPDNEPPGEPGVEHERAPLDEPRKTPTPTSLATPDFDADVRPLFTDFDIDSLKEFEGIDLNSEKSVKKNAARISARLKAGSLPYDGSWPPEAIDMFTRWAENIAEK